MSVSVAGTLWSFPFQMKVTLMREGRGLHRCVSSSLEAGRGKLGDAEYPTLQLPSLPTYTSVLSIVCVAVAAGLASEGKRKPNK